MSHADPYCLRRGPATWQDKISFTDLTRIASEQHWKLPTPITSIHITQYTASGRAKLLEVSGPTGTTQISASSLRFAINRDLGWNRIRSDLYSVAIANGMLLFAGRGYGHGVGLCQAGAFQMAIEHHSAAEILSFYFPNTRPGLTSLGDLWHSETVGAVTLRTITHDPKLAEAVQFAWQRALALLPPAGETPSAHHHSCSDNGALPPTQQQPRLSPRRHSR